MIEIASLIAVALVGIAAGFAWGILRSRTRPTAALQELAVVRARAADLEQRLDLQQSQNDALQRQVAELQAENARLTERAEAEKTRWEEHQKTREENRALQQQLEALRTENALLTERLEAENARLAERAEAEKARWEEHRKTREENRALQQQLEALRTENALLTERLEAEKIRWNEQHKALEDAQRHMRDAFANLAAATLERNTSQFLHMAKQQLGAIAQEAKGDLSHRQQAVASLIAPIKEALEAVTQQARAMEKERQQAYGTLLNQVSAMAVAQERLQRETANLVTALRKPQVRGRWGEIQLRNAVELAGMTAYCDFTEQVTTDSRMRPDMVIRLPNNKIVAVDAKAPLAAYLDATEAQDEEATRNFLAEHARQVRTHIENLGSKNYWSQFDRTPEFVVLFLPAENLFAEALCQDPALLEMGLRHKVLLAAPTTLIALLKAVAYGWSEQALAENAQRISAAAAEFHDRLAIFVEHLAKLGGQLDKSCEHYNKAVGSLERTLLPSLRRFREMGVPTTKHIPELPGCATRTRTPSVSE